MPQPTWMTTCIWAVPNGTLEIYLQIKHLRVGHRSKEWCIFGPTFRRRSNFLNVSLIGKRFLLVWGEQFRECLMTVNLSRCHFDKKKKKKIVLRLRFCADTCSRCRNLWPHSVTVYCNRKIAAVQQWWFCDSRSATSAPINQTLTSDLKCTKPDMNMVLALA